jgi:hypothetical protein
MASKLPIVVPPMRGEPAYERYLERLEAEARKRGLTIRGRTALVEYALTMLGLEWGHRSPRRTAPLGTNRFGEPRAKPGE